MKIIGKYTQRYDEVTERDGRWYFEHDDYGYTLEQILSAFEQVDDN